MNAWMRVKIPTAFWSELKAERLIDPRSPVPD